MRGGPKVVVALLNRQHRAQDLVARLAPLGYQRAVRDFLAHQPLVLRARAPPNTQRTLLAWVGSWLYVCIAVSARSQRARELVELVTQPFKGKIA